MVMKFAMVRYPRARTLAACTREFIASSMPLLGRERRIVIGIAAGGELDAVLEQDAESFDQVVGPTGEIGEGPLPDPCHLAVGLAEQDGRSATSTGDHCHSRAGTT